MATVNLETMAIDEKLILMEDLWDSLCHSNVEVQSPKWHKDILDDRVGLIKSGEAEYLSIQELKNLKV